MNPYTINMKDPESEMITVSEWIGVNKLKTASELQNNEMADAQNIQLIEDGLPDKRNGYDRIFADSLGTGKINGAYEAMFNSKIVFAWHTGLYTQSGSSAPTKIYDSLTDATGWFFTIGEYLYYKNGHEYVRISSAFAVVTVQSVAFIPTTTIGKPPAGGGTAFEPINLLQPLRKNSFIGDGTSTVFYVDATYLDATTVTAVVAGTTITEGAGLTVNRTTGAITFGTAPADGDGIDNVIPLFGKTITGNASKILDCTVMPVLFGGDNDTRVFMANSNIRYHSGLYDATYFPDTNYTKIGSEANRIMRFSQLGDTQIILKEHKETEPSVWSSRYELDASNTPYYPVIPINGVAGCDAKGCCEIVENNPTFLDATSGIYSLTVSNVRDQRIVTRLSDRVNPDLLAELNKETAISFVWGYRFGVCLNGRAYVWDYRLNVWYGIWTNINASCFFEISGELYFGSSTDGLMYKFNQYYNDDDEAIDAYFFTKHYSLGTNYRKKLLSRVYVDLKSTSACSVIPSYQTDKTSGEKFLRKLERFAFDYSLLNYGKFIYSSNSGFPSAKLRKLREKNYVWMQFKFSNSILGESMPILSTQYEFTTQNLVKDN